MMEEVDEEMAKVVPLEREQQRTFELVVLPAVLHVPLEREQQRPLEQVVIQKVLHMSHERVQLCALEKVVDDLVPHERVQRRTAGHVDAPTPQSLEDTVQKLVPQERVQATYKCGMITNLPHKS